MKVIVAVFDTTVAGSANATRRKVEVFDAETLPDDDRVLVEQIEPRLEAYYGDVRNLRIRPTEVIEF